jgi:hypothetical protein
MVGQTVVTPNGLLQNNTITHARTEYTWATSLALVHNGKQWYT